MTPTEHLHHIQRLRQEVNAAEGRLYQALLLAGEVVDLGTSSPTYGTVTDALCDMILHPGARKAKRQELPS